jgi:hypothetical protein
MRDNKMGTMFYDSARKGEKWRKQYWRRKLVMEDLG